MTDLSETNSPSGGPGPDPSRDPAQQSLAEALQVSFAILKVAMLALLVAYAFSGTFSVGSNEVALRLRFGDYVGAPGERVLERAGESVKSGDPVLVNLLNLSFQYIREQALGIFETRAVKIDQPELFKILREFGKPPEANKPESAAQGGHGKSESKAQATAPIANDGISTRIQNDKLDHLQDQVKKIIQTKNRLANFVRGLRSEFPDEKFPEDLNKIHEELSDHSAHMMDFFITLRVVPLGRIRELLARIVPETSQKLAREVEYTLEFDEQDSIDHEVLSRIETALVHTVRNSIDHGFEGRPTGNKIVFKITRAKPDRFEILIRDNGHGIHPEKLKETVLNKKICGQV
jgi:chemotaxis protein histidine kinase CheA